MNVIINDEASKPITSANPLPVTDSTAQALIGEAQATPTANTVLGRLKALLTGIVLAAGTNLIGKVGIDQTTPGTTNKVVADINGVTLVSGKVPVDLTLTGDTSLAASVEAQGKDTEAADVTGKPVTIGYKNATGKATGVTPTNALPVALYGSKYKQHTFNFDNIYAFNALPASVGFFGETASTEFLSWAGVTLLDITHLSNISFEVKNTLDIAVTISAALQRTPILSSEAAYLTLVAPEVLAAGATKTYTSASYAGLGNGNYGGHGLYVAVQKLINVQATSGAVRIIMSGK